MAFVTRDGQEILPGSYDIIFLEIIGLYDTLDLTYFMLEINIHESLFAPCITGSIVISDTLNIISNLPVLEGDVIHGKFTTSANDPYVSNFDPVEEIEFYFEVIKITKQEKIKQDNSIFVLAFTSLTWTDNLSNRVCKSYKQMPFSDMVKDIFNTHLSYGGIRGKIPIKGLLDVPTEGLFNVIIPNWKPYEAISWLSRRSYEGPAVNYLFYETKDSFHYLPLNKLLGRGPVETYFMSSADVFVEGKQSTPSLELMRPRYLSVNNLTFIEYHDITDSVFKGMLGNRMIKFNLFNREITDYHPKGSAGGNVKMDAPYDYFSDFGALDHCEKNKELVTKETSDKMGLNDANTLLSIESDYKFLWDDQESFKQEKWRRQRGGQLAQAQFVRLELTTPGNFSRNVGEKIKIEFISPQWKERSGPDSGSPEFDSRFNGNYLITALRRKFTGDNHTLVMEVVKDNYFDLKNDPIWDAARVINRSSEKDSGN